MRQFQRRGNGVLRRLNYRAVHGGKSAALIFWEPADAPRLPHGSPEHLVGAGQSAPAETIGLPISHSVGMTDFLDQLTGKSFSVASPLYAEYTSAPEPD